MDNKKRKIFPQIAVKHLYDINKSITVFDANETPGRFIDPVSDSIIQADFEIYGYYDDIEGTIQSNIIEEHDFSNAFLIGYIYGHFIPIDLILNYHYDPYTACDDFDSVLESMYSVINEFTDDGEFDGKYFIESIYYLHEIVIKDEYKNLGYEKMTLIQLPALLYKTLRSSVTIIMYCLSFTFEDEYNPEAEDIINQKEAFEKQFKGKNDTNVTVFPPIKKISEEGLNYIMGRRNPGSIVPKENRDLKIFRLYKSSGYKELGKSGWMYKYIKSIYE